MLIAIKDAVYDTLEGAGIKTAQAAGIMEHVSAEEILRAASQGLQTYTDKLHGTGDIPRPAAVNEGIIGTIMGLGLTWWLGKKLFGAKFKALYDEDPEVRDAADEISRGWEKLKKKHPSMDKVRDDANDVGGDLQDMGSDMLNKAKDWWNKA